MASQQLPGQIVINFYIKNTFVHIVECCAAEEEEGSEANSRRSTSAPPTMRAYSPDGTSSPVSLAPEVNDRDITAEDEVAQPVCEDGSGSASDGSGARRCGSDDVEDHDGDGEAAAYESAYTSMPEPEVRPAPPRKVRPSVQQRQQRRSEELFLNEEVARVRAEKWDLLAKSLVDLYSQKYSLNTVRIEMLVPQRRVVIHKLPLMHVAHYIGLTAAMIDAWKQERIFREGKENGMLMEIWFPKVDARQERLQVLKSACERFQKAYEEKHVLVMVLQTRAGWPNLRFSPM